MVHRVRSPSAAEDFRVAQGTLESPTGALSSEALPPLRRQHVGVAEAAELALLDHVLGVPAGDDGRKIYKRQPRQAAQGPARWVPPDVFKTKAVQKPWPRALHRIVAAVHVPEDIHKRFPPERVPSGAGNDRVADQPRRPSLEQHRVHRVLLTEYDSGLGLRSSIDERIEGKHRLHVNVRVDTTLSVKCHKAQDVGAFDAGHRVV
mmetsp:Transcript_16996/g.46397  ORF Transcript_16996/g.46397 Transcript_16996/m.46397 type:complete len:205 (-) Transcript_16996:697-1311(-)